MLSKKIDRISGGACEMVAKIKRRVEAEQVRSGALLSKTPVPDGINPHSALLSGQMGRR